VHGNEEKIKIVIRILFTYHSHPSIKFNDRTRIINGPSKADQIDSINKNKVGVNLGGTDGNYYITTSKGVVGKLTRDKFLGK
jgi:hypothetical protein